MATKHSNSVVSGQEVSGKGKRIGVVVSEWNHEITSALLDGCKRVLLDNEVDPENIFVEFVPGSFELPMGARLLATGKKLDAIVCIGCVIKGETKHDEYIAQSVANGIMQLSLMTNTPIIFGVLTPNSMEQAKARAGGDLGNKGEEAAVAALRMAALKKTHGSVPNKIGFS